MRLFHMPNLLKKFNHEFSGLTSTIEKLIKYGQNIHKLNLLYRIIQPIYISVYLDILKCTTYSENLVFEKWNFTTNDKANQHSYHNEWRGGAESWVMIWMLICQFMSCEISFFKNHIFRNFISIFLYKELDDGKFWEICQIFGNTKYIFFSFHFLLLFYFSSWMCSEGGTGESHVTPLNFWIAHIYLWLKICDFKFLLSII